MPELSQNLILPLPGIHPLIPETNTIPPNDTDYLNSQISLAALGLMREYLLSNGSQRMIPQNVLEKFQGLNLHDEQLLNTLMNSRPPCRWEEIYLTKELKLSEEQTINYKIRIVLDIAHNAPAIESLMDKVKLKLPNENLRFARLDRFL